MTLTNANRRIINRQRRALSEQQRRLASQLASLQLNKLTPRLPKAANVGIYLDDFGELPTQPLLDWCSRMGYSAHIPVINTLGKHNKTMRFAPVNQSHLVNIPTVRHRFGMKESKQRHLIWVHQLDLILCPLVAADEHGNRMGMGGGFYDTTLATCCHSKRKKPLRIGWCYEFQVVEQLQTQPWDVPLHALITPKKIRWFK